MKKVTGFILFISLTISLQIYTQEKTIPEVNLHIAVLQGNLDAVKQHIEAGSDLNKKDAWGSTPLIIAIIFDRTEVAEALINAGADLTIGNNEGNTPLQIAAFFGRSEIVGTLLDKGADRYIRNIDGSTAFDIVAAPFEYDKQLYDKISAGLIPLGLVLDYEKIKKLRPQIAEMLRPGGDELKSIDYTPLIRNDWKTSTPEKQELDPMLVAELYDDAAHMETLYGLLVIKNGYLIAEGYFNGASVEQLSSRASVTKSFTSALLGIALDQNYIESVDQKMIDFFPEVSDQITDERKKLITIRDMLQMRAGYPWEETDTTYWNAMWSGRYINKIVDIPLTKDPGSEFQYSNLTSNWLGIIIARTSKTDLKSFGEKNLFSPLNVEIGNWKKDWDGYYIGCADLEVTARDMAKFGLLYLNKGEYEGKQLIPTSWVNESLQKYSDDINSGGIKSGKVARYFYDIGYGYQWWSAKAGDHFFNLAWGHGGQFIILLHDLDMIIVVTSDPFYGKENHFNAWQYEKSNINLVGKFIKSLPKK
jgi:CubicO group peptidase (beta-lactamase class C family)